MKNWIVGLTCVGVTLLTACGGGGGKAAADSQISISGGASKGVLVGADVKAYEVINGAPSATVLASAVTDSKGDYALKIKPTSNPVLVKISTNVNTRMYDETQVEADGTFKLVLAPANLEMRSFVSAGTDTITVQINPLTEAAVTMASQAVLADHSKPGLTRDALLAAQQVVLRMGPAGVNPFLDKPPTSTQNMTEAETHQALFYAGLVKSNAPSCDLNCQIKKLSQEVQLTLDGQGVATLSASDAGKLQQQRSNLLSQGKTALLASSNQSGLGSVESKVSNWAKQAILVSQNTPIPTQTQSASDFSRGLGFEGFARAIRQGIVEAYQKIMDSQTWLDSKYPSVTTDLPKSLKNSLGGSVANGVENLGFVGQALKTILNDCVKGKSSFTCNSQTSDVKWVAEGGAWRMTSKSRGQTLELKVSGTVDQANDVANLSVSEGKFWQDANAPLLLAEIKSGALIVHHLDSDNPSVSASASVSLVVYDQTPNSTLAGQVDLTRLSFEEVSGKTTMAGGIQIQGLKNGQPTGDTFSGSLSVEGESLGLSTSQLWGLTSMVLDLSARVNDVVSGKIQWVVSRELGPKRLEPTSESNFGPYSVEVLASLSTGLQLTEKLKRSEPSKIHAEFMVNSGGNQVTFMSDFVRAAQVHAPKPTESCLGEMAFQFCTSQITITSLGNPYTAVLTRNNGTWSGDVLNGQQVKVGEIHDKILQINGVEYSIY